MLISEYALIQITSALQTLYTYHYACTRMENTVSEEIRGRISVIAANEQCLQPRFNDSVAENIEKCYGKVLYTCKVKNCTMIEKSE